MSAVETEATAKAKARYNRLAPVYDWQEAIAERLAYSRWRKRLWSQIQAGRVLEVGVGTGKSMPY